jgi:hypothetical protein
MSSILNDASKSVCVREHWYLLISTLNPSNSSVMYTYIDPQCPGPSAFLVEHGDAPESIAGELDTPKLVAERDI